MEFKVTEKKDNPLLERTEVKLNASFSGATPSFAKIRTELIKFLKSDKNLTVVDGIKQEFGAHEVSCYAKVYASSQAMTVEPQHRLTKNFEAVEKEKPAEPEDKPAEASAEKTEEKPAEPEDKPPAEASEKEKPAVEDSVIEDVKEPTAEAEVNEDSGEEKSGGEEKPAVEESSEVAEDVSSVKKNAKEGEAVEVESAGETQEESKDEDSGVKSAGEE